MCDVIEALYIYDEQNQPILSHTFTARPPSAKELISLYLANPEPRPSLIYLPNTNPSTILFSLIHTNLLFLVPSSTDVEPLLVLEFLHRVTDVLEEFIGAPLLSSKIEGSYDVVAQLLNEMCDAGAVSTTEGNALRDLVEVEGFMGKLLAGINLPGKPGFTGASAGSSVMPGISSLGATNALSLPWRRTNVRHTSNELYVDMLETLSVTLAPSGRPIAAFAYGTIAFTSKISGVPDILLVLSSSSGTHNMENVMELPVFHPCVRLAKWRERPGELSFIPPDGRFILAGYEVDLLPFTSGKMSNSSANLKLPIDLEVKTSLGPTGADFEVRLFISKIVGTSNSTAFSSSSSRPIGRLGGSSSGFSGLGSNSPSSPILDDLVITVPIPPSVKNLSDIRASRGETSYNPGDKTLEWAIRAKEVSAGTATLRCTVVAEFDDEEHLEGNGFSFDDARKECDYNENENKSEAYQSSSTPPQTINPTDNKLEKDEKRVDRNKILMPNSARASFAVKGWLASGIKVESVTIDTRKSRGLGEGVKPYKGVKYLCISNGGVEIRC